MVKRGRPRTGVGGRIHVRFHPEQEAFLGLVVAGLTKHEGDRSKFNYNEAIRQCVTSCMAGKKTPAVRDAVRSLTRPAKESEKP